MSTPPWRRPTRRRKERPVPTSAASAFIRSSASRPQAVRPLPVSCARGTAGSNTAADHIEVLTRAPQQLPPGAVNPGTLVRTDSAGATHAFTDAVCARKLSFSVGLDLTEPVREAILSVPESCLLYTSP